MSLSKKHFEAIAHVLRCNYPAVRINPDEHTSGRQLAIELIADDLADLFAEENPNFDRDRFLKACGVE